MAYAWSEYSRGQLRGGAAPDRCRWRGRPGPPAHRRQRLRAAPQPGHDHRRPAVVRVRRDHGARPRRQRARPACARGPRPAGSADEHDGMREPGGKRASRTAARGHRGDPGGVRRRTTGWCSRPASWLPGSNVAPSALPRLQATPDGGLVVGYRIHRQLPLMTYYWEAAVQVLGAGGLAAADHVQRHRRHPRGGVAGAPPSAGSCWPPSPTGGWSGPCTGPRGSAGASARTSPTTTAP